MNDTRLASGIGLSGVCFLWGIVTQCLNWAGVFHWPWYACWGPMLCIIGLWVIALLFVVLIGIITALIRR